MNRANTVANQIRYMCATFKNRIGGSDAEMECQNYMQNELAGYADTVKAQQIMVCPDAGWIWIVFAAIGGMVSILLPLVDMQSTVFATVSFLTSLLAIGVVFFHFLSALPALDAVLPKRTAKNVFATKAPKGEVKRRVVFVGHADAAYEMTYSHRGGASKVLRVAATSSIGLVLIFILNTILFFRSVAVGSIALGSIWYWLRVGQLLLLPTCIEALFFFDTKCVVDGANDNLSGCAVAMETVREFSRRDRCLNNTEVCCLITSSEECGLRGAREFARQYAVENDGIETAFIVLDTLHDPQQLMLYTKGLNGFQKNSPEVADLILKSADSIGLKLPEAGPYPGATDAEAFSREGLQACAICGVEHTPQPYYHTRSDNADNIDEQCLDICLQLCCEIAEQLDRQVADETLAIAV